MTSPRCRSFRAILGACVGVSLTAPTWAATIPLGTSGSWGTAADWVGGVVPTGTNDAAIGGGLNATVGSGYSDALSRVDVGTASGAGTLTLSGGTLNVSNAGSVALIVGSAGAGTLNVASGAADGWISYVGYGNGTGTSMVNISGGSFTSKYGLYAGFGASTTGVINQSGGLVTVTGGGTYGLVLGRADGSGTGLYGIDGSGTLDWNGASTIYPGSELGVTGSTPVVAYAGATNTASNVLDIQGTLAFALDAHGIAAVNCGASQVGLGTGSILNVDGNDYTGTTPIQFPLLTFGQLNGAESPMFSEMSLTRFNGALQPNIVSGPDSVSLALDGPPAFAASLASAPAFAVRSYGAIPNQATDAGPAIRAAIAAAIASGGPAQVVFESGTYPIGPVAGNHAWWPKAALVVFDAENLLIRGVAGTKLVVTDPTSSGVVVNGCQNVAVTGIAIDYDPAPFTQTTVTAVNAGTDTFTVQIDPGHPDLVDYDNPGFAAAMYGNAFTVGPDGRPVYNPYQIQTAVSSKTGASTWTLQAPSGVVGASGIAVGNHFFSRLSSSTAGFSFLFSAGVWADHVTIYSSPSVAFYPALSSGITLSNCAVVPAAGRWVSSDRDGVHATSNREGITIRNCDFSGMGDDSINLLNGVALPVQKISNSEFVFQAGMFEIQAGDVMEAIHPETGAILGKNTVASVTTLSGPAYNIQVTFTQPFGTIALSTDGTSATGDQFYDLSQANNDFEIRNNVFGRHLGREVLISAYQGTVQNNVFDNGGAYLLPASSNPGYLKALYDTFCVTVQLHFDWNYAEGPIAENVHIWNNQFAAKGAGQYASGRATLGSCIWIADAARGNTTTWATSVSHNAIDIEGNTFTDLSAPAVNLSYTSALTLKNNLVEATGTSKPAPVPPDAFLLIGDPSPAASGNRSGDPAFTTVLQVNP